MTKKMYKSEKNALIFDIVYTLVVTVSGLSVYLFGVSVPDGNGIYLGLFVLGAYMLFMFAGIVIRSQLFSKKLKRGEKAELNNIASLFFA